jgi:alkyl hydroperoxide reductase subunit AhpF
MAILTDRDRAAVTEELGKLAGPVKLVVFGQQLGPGAEYSLETERLIREVAACSDKVAVEIYNLHIDRDKAAGYGVDRTPAIVVEGSRDYGIRFFGIPAGYEFTNLIDGMQVAASGEPKLSPETLERLAGLTDRIHIQVFTTPT